ncbi:MAG: hypothetical protein P4M11_10810 [Candidatus Pacebacteria bacterium]|nr:hypothetical protein [Candidatus Paceibacterota bacterium]
MEGFVKAGRKLEDVSLKLLSTIVDDCVNGTFNVTAVCSFASLFGARTRKRPKNM